MIGGGIGIVVLIVIAVIHVYWAAGGRLGHAAAIPEREGKPAFSPGRWATLAVAAALLVAAALVAADLGWLVVPVPAWLVRVAVWLLALVFAARAIGDFRYVGFFKRVAGSRFAQLDTRVYAPLCALLAIAMADAALEGG
jgi:hypothetical protein